MNKKNHITLSKPLHMYTCVFLLWLLYINRWDDQTASRTPASPLANTWIDCSIQTWCNFVDVMLGQDHSMHITNTSTAPVPQHDRFLLLEAWTRGLSAKSVTMPVQTQPKISERMKATLHFQVKGLAFPVARCVLFGLVEGKLEL